MKLIYLGIDLLSISIPLAFSTSKRFGFGSKLKFAWIAVALSAIPFLIWDIYFTQWGVWSFNAKYTLGLSVFGLPLEEILFFFCIPFSCLFIYHALHLAPSIHVSQRFATPIWLGIGILSFIGLFLASGKTYTMSVLFLVSLTAYPFVFFKPTYSGQLITALGIQYIPFLIMNGLLTALPIVQYRDADFSGFRIGTIPIEDALYALILLAVPVAIFEWLKSRANR